MVTLRMRTIKQGVCGLLVIPFLFIFDISLFYLVENKKFI